MKFVLGFCSFLIIPVTVFGQTKLSDKTVWAGADFTVHRQTKDDLADNADVRVLEDKDGVGSTTFPLSGDDSGSNSGGWWFTLKGSTTDSDVGIHHIIVRAVYTTSSGI